MALILTYPGVPSIYAGDELGLEGENGEAGRRTIAWDRRDQWDLEFLQSVKDLIAIRRTNIALCDGGLRWLEISDDYLFFARESSAQTLLIFISRSAVQVNIDLTQFGFSITRTLFGKTQSGTNISIYSQSATSGIWEVTH